MIEITDLSVLKRQAFVTIQDILDEKYFDLAYEPIIETVHVNQPNGKKWIYGVHYVVVESDINLMHRISWAADDCPDGDGMESTLEEYETIEVQYLVKED